MLYAEIYEWLGWPRREEAFQPSGEGARVYAGFARKKIQGAMRTAHPGVEVEVGIIAADPNSNSTEAPLAVICEFPRAASNEVLDLSHTLAWNFCRTALLITLEPHRIIAWSCYQDPTKGGQRRVAELPTADGLSKEGTTQQQRLRDLLHWVNLVTHRSQAAQPEKFQADGRADALLLKNLRYVRGELLKMGLAREHCHDLLARVIFTQFLFHRKDSDGNAFFSARKMQRLHDDGVLSKVHHDFASVLSRKSDTYGLFRWMDERFNGDLFPGKEDDDDFQRDATWRNERDAVSKAHLDLLIGLIRGNLDVTDRQLTLWPYYCFDTIPLEFISSVYEEFLTADERGSDKAYYTPPHLVDYVLDAVLPWNGDEWNLRILDPCCGSGIFLVKAFQRLIHRWRRAKGREPLVTDLRPLLENNLIGVDKNPEAVRVACFSLYLAMVDAIEPKHYVTHGNYRVFPRLRGTRLICQDFFDEETPEIRGVEDRENFDVVLGNAPWGDGSIKVNPLSEPERESYAKRVFNISTTKDTSTRAQIWAKAKGWPVANNDVGPLFLAKAAALAKPTGFVAMVNTASLLYWRDGRAMKLRKKLFTSFSFEEVTNLSALRHDLFSEAIGPCCIVVFRTAQPSGYETLHYYAPKPPRAIGGSRRNSPILPELRIEPYDISLISHSQAHESPWAWSALALGGQRHFSLVERVSVHQSLESLELKKQVKTRKGVIPGRRQLHLPEQEGKPILATPDFPTGVFLELDPKSLPRWDDARVTSGDSTDFSAFKSPQMLIKLSYASKIRRMRAVRVKRHPRYDETICQGAFITCHDLSDNERHIRAACAAYNSGFAVVFFALTSTSFPLYTCKLTVRDALKLPLPPKAPAVEALKSFDAIDEAVRKAFNFTAADWTLIEDLLVYTLPDLLRQASSPARAPTQRKGERDTIEPELTSYATTFSRVVSGTFGKDRKVAATIFTEPQSRHLPVRMVTFHLDSRERIGVSHEEIEADGLLDKLTEFHVGQLKRMRLSAAGGGLGFQRVAYLFDSIRENGRRVMNLTIVKPDECRYWTRSMAMRDADQLAAAILKAAPSRKTSA